MGNSLLTIDMVTRASLVILHQKCNFIGNINRQYDDQFAKTGAKIGNSLRVRLPVQYTVSSGPTLATQDTQELQVSLTVSAQGQVAMNFSSAEFTMQIDEFTKRYIEPSISVLAASLESNALGMVEEVYQAVDNSASSMSMAQVTAARTKLINALAPKTGDWTAVISAEANAELVNANKGLFQAATEIATQYKEGMMGRTGGFDFYENTLLPSHTTGTTSASPSNLAVTTTITSSATSPTTTIAVTSTGTSGTWKNGDIFTISTLFRVHPETKTNTGQLQQLSVVGDVALGTTQSITISPPIYITGAYQNATLSAVLSSGTIAKVGNTGTTYRSNVFFQPDAFTFATADLIKPNGVDMVSRQVKDGISMRILRDYDPNYDRLVTRCDVLYGYRSIRPQLAARVLNGT